MIDFKDISVVIQGPIIGRHATKNEDRHTELCIASLRKHLPGSNIIISTWKGSDFSGLDYDSVVENEDPGENVMGDFSKNCFRQVISSLNGLKTVKTKYALKIRSDIVIKSSNFIKLYIKFNNIKFNKDYKILDKRVVTMTTCNPKRRLKFPYTVSDWFFFGQTSDVTNIFDIPLVRKNIIKIDSLGNKWVCDSLYSAEQYIWFSFLLKYRQISFNDMDDISNDNIINSERYIANNLIILPANMVKLNWLKYPGAGYAQIPCLSNTGFYTWNDYKRLLNNHSGANISIIINPIEEIVYTTVYPFRFWLRNKNRKIYDIITNIVNGKNHKIVSINMQKDGESAKIRRIVIWGLRKKFHTHRYIHKAFYENAKKLGYDVIWVEDEKENQKYIKSGDLIISAEPVGKMVPEKFSISDYSLPIRNDVFYCLHKFKDIFLCELKNKVDKNRILELLVYENKAEESDVKIRPVVFFDSQKRILYQPWGTNLLPHEFRKPVFNKNKFVFWIGSIWNDKNNHGNLNEIRELKESLKKNGLKFIHLRFIPDWLNIILIRLSRIAPAIGGRIQAEVNYLPCRVFKNISYGQLAITNVKKFKDILGECFIEGDTIEELISNSLLLDEKSYKEMVIGQQKCIQNYTYEQAIKNIVKAFYL